MRCFVAVLEEKTGVKVDASSPLLAWAIRHAGWVIHRYRALSTGRTSHELTRGRPYSGEVAEFGELVFARDPRPSTAASLSGASR